MPQFLDSLINGPSRYAESHHFQVGWALAFALGILFAEVITVYLFGLLLIKAAQNFRPFVAWVLRKCGVGEKEVTYVFLELTFPSDTSKSAFATEQLHILMRSQASYRHFWDKWAGRKRLHSLELVSTRDNGIRYVIRIPEDELEYTERSLRSYLPGLKIKQVEDYMTSLQQTTVGVVELKLSADFVLPLQDHKALAEHDPIAYLTGHMTKLEPDELVAFQVVVTPVLRNTHSKVLRRVRDMQHRIALAKELSSKLIAQRTPLGYAWWLIWFPTTWFVATAFKVMLGAVDFVVSIFAGGHDLPEFMKSGRDKRRTDNPYELELGKIIKAKLDQHLFEVAIRVLVASKETGTISDRLDAIAASFQPFTGSYQAIGLWRPLPFFKPAERQLARFKERALYVNFVSQSPILSSSELSDLYHFPNTDLTKTEGLVKNRSRELPTPLSIKHSNANLDVVVGVNKHGGDEQLIGMTLDQRQKHTYVIGKTGTGKTTLLKSSIYQDMANGKGLAVFDPHGDMFQELLGLVPKHRQKDVVVFDPSDREHPIGLNILDPGVEFADEDDKNEWITSTVLSVFEKLADEKLWGPRMEHILRNATMTALQTPKPSLYTIQRLLTDKKYQAEVAKTLKDPVLKQFWDKELKLLGTMQLSSVTAPLTHRLGHFITSKMSRHILLQEKSTVRIADIMNEGKILLVNLSKGDIGEDQGLFFGTILTSFIWMAAYQRTKIPERERRDFFVYVDEFQNFATPRFSEITSEGRKFHIGLIVSHQNIAQIEDKSILKIVAGNAATVICLKASPDDEAFILPFMRPEVEKGDIVNLAPYHFYMKVTSGESEDAFSGETVPVGDEGSKKVRDTVTAASRGQYATPKAQVEKYLEQLFAVKEAGKKPRVHTRSSKAANTASKVHGT